MGQVIGPSFEVKDIEPAGVRRAPVAQRRAFWGAVSNFVIAAKDAELRAGLDRWGNPLHAIAKYTREHRESAMGPADPGAPPLQPAHGLSRTRSLFWAEPDRAATRVVCWWLYDTHTGESWGEILRKHAAGGRRLPIRDVIGLAPASLAKIQKQAAEWWAQYEGEAPAPRPLPYRSPGWGKSVRTPEGKFIHVPIDEVAGEIEGKFVSGQEALRRRGLPRRVRERLKARQVKIGNHVYTMQGGLGVEMPKPPPRAFGAAVPKPPTPTPSPTVVKVDRNHQKAVLKNIQKILGPDATPQTVADLAGAPKGTTSTVFNAGYRDENLAVYFKAKGIDYAREIRQAERGGLALHNVNASLAKDLRGQGLGTEIMGRQIEAARKLDFRYMYTAAAGSPGDPDTVGFKVWPKLGYDGELPDRVIWRLPGSLKDAKRISDLYATPEGRAWWEANGETIGLRFDLTPGSYSLRVWEAYLRERQARPGTP